MEKIATSFCSFERLVKRYTYVDQYKGDKRPVTLVGINFRLAKRNIDEPLFAGQGASR